MSTALIRLVRPRDWAKSVFVLLPMPFAARAGAQLDPVVVAAGVAAFCLVASAVYVVNDIRDVEADRAHPDKQRRPIAAGEVPIGAAAGLAVGLLAGGLLLAGSLGRPAVVAILLIYVASNAVYSLGAKHVPLVDVFLLAAGFVLRVLAGCALADVAPSNWLLSVSMWVALFLAFAKRRADLSRGLGAEQRPALEGYNITFVDQAMGLAAGITLLSYGLYSQEAALFVPGRELAGMPFVAFGLLHYLRLAQLGQVRVAPVEMAYRSRTLQLCSIGWLGATLWSLGWF